MEQLRMIKDFIARLCLWNYNTNLSLLRLLSNVSVDVHI